MELEIQFNMDGEDFDIFPEREASKILRDIADDIDNGLTFGNINMSGNNTIGCWEIKT